MNARMRSTWRPLLVAAACWSAVALAGGLATAIGPWYWELKKPWFQPPDWVFGPAWTVIFLLNTVASADGWQAAPDASARYGWTAALVVNGLLNVAWSVLFFYLRRPDLALIEVALLWLSIAALIVKVRRWSRRAALLLAPYLAWVTFASLLNLEVVRLNAQA